MPLLRLEQARTPDTAELTQARRLLASQGQALPEQHRPALQDLRIACFHTDHLGTPLRLSDDQGRLLWRATPDDWAAVRDQQGDTDQPIRFQGQYHDAESGLYYNRYRYYAPDLGRYVSQDPIGLLGGMNGYIYSEITPSLSSDPLGLSPAFAGAGGLSNQQLGDYAQAQAAINSATAGFNKIKGMLTWESPYAPDYVSAGIDVYFASANIVYTRYGDIFGGAGAARSYPKGSLGGNVSAGYLLCAEKTSSPSDGPQLTSSRNDLNNFLNGWGKCWRIRRHRHGVNR